MIAPWPEILNGARKQIGLFAPCSRCGRGSWVRYGDVTCLWCALGVPPPADADWWPISFSLSEEECVWMRRLADARGAKKRGAGVQTQKIDQQRTDFEIDYLAVRAHYVISRWAGVPFDESVTIGGGAGYLVKLQKRVIQVRSTLHSQGHLIFNSAEDVGADLIILCVPRVLDEGVTAVGWTDRTTFLAAAKRESFGYGERLSLAQPRLRPMTTWPLTMRGSVGWDQPK